MNNLKDIQSVYMPEDIREEIKKHDEVFDLSKFYLDNIDQDYVMYTGFQIITPNQKFNCFCAPFSRLHEELIENILFSLFDDYNRIYRSLNYNWRDTSSALGCIACQLVSKYYSLVWMPKYITEYQYEKFLDFYHDMNKINENLINSGEKQIDILVNFKGENGKDLPMSFDESIKYAKSIVKDDLELFPEHLINSKNFTK